jgi:hypothetical protein
LPRFDVDVWRRCRWKDVPVIDPDASGVADKRHAAWLIEVADVMRRVTGRVSHIERATARPDVLAPGYDHDVLFGDCGNLAPQLVHAIAVESCRARQQLRRIGEMRRSPLVHHDLDVRVPSNDRSGGPCVIQMDVRQQQMRDATQLQALRLPLRWCAADPETSDRPM